MPATLSAIIVLSPWALSGVVVLVSAFRVADVEESEMELEFALVPRRAVCVGAKGEVCEIEVSDLPSSAVGGMSGIEVSWVVVGSAAGC